MTAVEAIRFSTAENCFCGSTQLMLSVSCFHGAAYSAAIGRAQWHDVHGGCQCADGPDNQDGHRADRIG